MTKQRPLLSILLALSALSGSIIGGYALDCGKCRSNETHVAWKNEESLLLTETTPERWRSLSSSSCCCVYQPRKDAEKEALQYLRDNLMPFDEAQFETLGFVDAFSDAADGLSNGLVGPSVTLALDAKRNYTWADDLPKSIFLEYVVNYANANEARTNWRPLLVDTAVYPIIARTSPSNVSDVVRVLNTHLWTALSRRDNESIVFVSSQTPLIFDPMSVIAFQYASCTGLAILFVDALRAAGVAARLAGTPAWMQNRTRGNHNWVEVYVDGQWYFMEPSPAQQTIDTLERDPCKRWFCQSDSFPGTEVFAARLDLHMSETHYPMAWEWNSTDVPGVDRTDYYTEVCSRC